MVLLAELLADLTSLKTLNTSDALALVNSPHTDTTTEPTDREFTRAKEFLALRSEQRGLEDLIAKRRGVAAVMEGFGGRGAAPV